MNFRRNLTVEQMSELFPILLKLVEYSFSDIKSYDELTPSERDIFNNDEDLFSQLPISLKGNGLS